MYIVSEEYDKELVVIETNGDYKVNKALCCALESKGIQWHFANHHSNKYGLEFRYLCVNPIDKTFVRIQDPLRCYKIECNNISEFAEILDLELTTEETLFGKKGK